MGNYKTLELFDSVNQFGVLTPAEVHPKECADRARQNQSFWRYRPIPGCPATVIIAVLLIEAMFLSHMLRHL